MAKPKKSVVDMKPYINGQHSRNALENSTKIMKLDSNESSMAPSPRVVVAITDFIHRYPLNWYPDIESSELIDKLEEYTALPRKFIQTFSGSDNGLETICRTYLTKGDEVVLCMPSYDHFRLYAEASDATLVPVRGESPFTSKPDLLLKAVTDKTKIIYIVNPNNPTGMLYSLTEIEHILQNAPHVLVIVDEAYFEFSRITAAPLVEKYKNLVVSRSFSKAFGLAGLRCGYILTDNSNLEIINKVRVGKNINSLAQVAARAALDDVEYMRQYVVEVESAREWLCEKMRSIGLTALETPANFILVKVANPEKVISFLQDNDIFIRNRSQVPQLEGFVRITIGHIHLMERFWRIFQKIPAENLIIENQDLEVKAIKN